MIDEATLHETKKYRCLVYHRVQTTDLYLTLCGVEACVPGKVFHTGERPGYHLHVILTGKGTLSVNGVRQEVRYGQMFMTKPGEDAWYAPDEKDPWTYCWMTFDGKLAGDYAGEAGFTDGINRLDCHVDQQRFYEAVKKVLEQPDLTLSSDLMRISALVEYIALAIESHGKVHQRARQADEYAPDVYVELALDFIRNNYTTVKVSDVADYIGIHRSYLTSIFKKKVGISPQEYLMQYKLKQSQRLLLETQLPIQEVALRVGYDNPLTFSKIFKNEYGASPKNYRIQNQERNPEDDPV